MTYKIDFDRWGRFFNVPCNIVDEHLKLADGDFVKVLLCILSGDSTADSEQLSALSGVNEPRVNDAVHYWADLGVIRVEGLPQREKAAVAASASIAPKGAAVAVKEKPLKTSLRYSPKELANKLNGNDELKYIVTEYEKIKGTVIKDNEIMGLLNLNEYYGFDAQSLILMIEYCHKLGKDSMAYLEKLARDWFDREIISYPDVEAEIIKQSRIKSYEYKAVKALGLKGKPSTNQAQTICSWQEKGISIEMLEIAYDKCMDAISEPNFKYISKIVDSWFNEGIKTAEAVKEYENSKGNKAVGKSYNNKNGSSRTSYDLDEWEKFAMSFDPENGGS